MKQTRNFTGKEHFYLEGEGGYIKIVQKDNKYARVSEESALADFLDDDEGMNLHNVEVYDSLEEAFANSSLGMLEYALELAESGVEYARFSEEGMVAARKVVCSEKDKRQTDLQ